MNRLAVLFIPATLAMGCAVAVGPDLGTTNVQFNWTFSAPNGGTSCVDADVQIVSITIAGTTQSFACNDFASGAGQSGEIDGVPDDTTSYTVSGYSNTYDIYGNYTGQVESYSGSFTTSLAGGTLDVENFSLTPLTTSAANSNIILLWTFAGQSCSAIGAPMVTITITDTVNPANSVNQPVPCTQNGVDGAKITSFAAGNYPFTLSASTATTDYFGSGSLYVNGYSDTAAHVDLGADSTITPPSTGPGNATFNVSFGSSGMGCTSGGIGGGTLGYYVTDNTGAIISGTQGTTPCNDPLSPLTFSGLSGPGTYYLSAEGLTSGSTVVFRLEQYQFEVYPAVTSSYSVDIPALPNGL